MEVAAILIFDARPLRAPHGGLDMARIRAVVEFASRRDPALLGLPHGARFLAQNLHAVRGTKPPIDERYVR
jgi:hypothetical protein